MSKPAIESSVPEFDFSKTDEFWRAIEHEAIGRTQPDPAPLFRGVWNADFELIPSSRRKDGMDWLDGLGKEYRGNSELGALSEFYIKANETGLALPSVPSAIHQDLVNAFDQDKMNASAFWPNNEVLEILAIAQHHGLKTPLLDWSRSPLVAMKFAASEAVSELFEVATNSTALQQLSKRRMAVWVLLQGHCSKLSVDACMSPYESYGSIGLSAYEIKFISPTTRDNPNIVAQMGLFSFHMKKIRHGNQQEDPCASLRHAVEQNYGVTELNNLKSLPGILTKFTLPISCAPELLRRLEMQGITTAKLFPGFDGCVKAVDEARKTQAVIRALKDNQIA